MTSDCRTTLASVCRATSLGLAVTWGVMIFAAGGADAETVTIQAFESDRENPEAREPVPEFRFLVNGDTAHDNPSITHPRSYSPIVAEGDDASATVELPPGKYLVSVLGGPFPAVPGEAGRDCAIDEPCGYKLAGEHFTVEEGSNPTVEVFLVPNPLPLATLQVRVLHDNLDVNNEDNIPLEAGLEGFHVTVSDPTGEITVDFFNEPICGGLCLTDADGRVTIPNLPPLKYAVEVIPPDGEGWIQTSTIEGTHAFDAWLEENADGLSTEEGFTQAATWFGFVRACRFGDPDDDCPSNDVAGDNTITGRIRQIVDIEAPGQVLLGAVVPRVFVALNNIGGNDEQIWTGRSDPDGTFTIPDVPPGLYQVVYWDFPQEYIIQFATVAVPDGASGQTIDAGDLGIPRWFGTIAGYVYTDSGVAYLIVLHEIDPDLHRAVENGLTYDATVQHDRYWTVNGRSFPDTIAENFVPWLPAQPHSALVTVEPFDEESNPLPALVRYANAGMTNHPFHPHGNNQRIIARDGRLLRGLGDDADLSYESFTTTVGAGQTYDLLAQWFDLDDWSSGGNPLPLLLPGLQDLVFKDDQTLYSGSPYLGEQDELPPVVTPFNECGELYFPWHSHALNEFNNFDEGFGGLATLWRVEPPGGC